MGYSIMDLMDNFISIEKLGYERFLMLADSKAADVKVKTLARVFAAQEMQHIEKYNYIKQEMMDDKEEEIDFDVYDKAVKFINDFNNSFINISVENTKEFLKACLNFEKENLALATFVQGLFVRTKKDVTSTKYKLMTEIINEEQKHVENIEIFLK